jgi:hypothetical protein
MFSTSNDAWLRVEVPSFGAMRQYLLTPWAELVPMSCLEYYQRFSHNAAVTNPGYEYRRGRNVFHGIVRYDPSTEATNPVMTMLKIRPLQHKQTNMRMPPLGHMAS